MAKTLTTAQKRILDGVRSGEIKWLDGRSSRSVKALEDAGLITSTLRISEPDILRGRVTEIWYLFPVEQISA